ncbi:PDZ domain-containing protein [Janibacter anophelis]|uniref:YlbL family protein n=1 Tax=Janibacter anophelis TaxID=319054 RepID=UPI00082CF713|nr:PDZ domain-containing protein [Janibacter anophelis]
MTDPVHTVPRSERIARWVLVVSFLVLIVTLAGMLIKVPYAIERPGPATDTLGTLSDGSELVTVKGAKSYPTEGALYFTTVRVLGGPERHITGWEYVMGHLDGDSRVVPEEQLFPEGVSEDEIEQLNEAQMQGSQKNSIAVGMRSTGVEVPQDNIVASIGKGYPAADQLELEDEIVSVDGKRTNRVADVVDGISDRKPGDDVDLVIRRDGKERKVTVETTDLGGGRAGIGIGIESTFDYPFEVRIDAGNVGGPSAGMMFALAVRDRLTPGAMTGGERIAGTGTIDDSGVVGPIGGIAQKMVGAQETGADWFLAPESNCGDVVGHVPDGLTVVPVGDFTEASDTVEDIAKGETADFATCEDVVANAG